jgi:protein-disulfide isomerase
VAAGELALIIRHLPLSAIHPFAMRAAEAAECAAMQGRFEQMNAKLFALPSRLTEPMLHEYAASTDLDAKRFRECMNGAGFERVRFHLQTAATIGIDSTPTLILGRKKSSSSAEVIVTKNGYLSQAELESLFETYLRSR